MRRRRSADLSTPRYGRGFGLHYDPEAFGRFSEGLARTLGTGRYLVAQTVVVVVWITLNVIAAALRFDPYPFILLNLAFSTQAAYAAPLILLAQNRQDARDRAQADEDRRTAALVQAETEYLAREVANIRILVASLPTAEELTNALERVTEAIERIAPPDHQSTRAVGH
ncbi:MAG TPA: DUF1003 domain-containing protein [Acidimicrobiia bacterium]|nr:DUF1003 domain-containing protein [Acidimicrobiia bacterium]